MGDRLVLWSGGGRFVASKDVASAAIVQLSGGVQVDWGNGDIQIISGTSGIYSAPSGRAGFVAVRKWSASCVPTYSFVVIRQWGVDIVGSFSSPPSLSQLNWNSLSAQYSNFSNPSLLVAGADYLGTSADTLGCSSPRIVRGSYRCFVKNLTNGFKTSLQGVGSDNDWPLNFSYRYQSKAKVITDLGGISERDTAVIPSIVTLMGGCAIAVTFTDGSKVDIPVTYQPTWVQVKPANSCPQNTCFECEHDGEKCCFAKDTDGLIKLIDRFHIV